MSNAFLPRGTQFKRSPDGTTYTTIAEAKKISISVKGSFEDDLQYGFSDSLQGIHCRADRRGKRKGRGKFHKHGHGRPGGTLDRFVLADASLLAGSQLFATRVKFLFQGFVE